MSPRSKKEYLEAIYLRYKESSRKEKKRILDEFCATFGYHRKHAIRLLRKFKSFRKTQTKKRGRASFYSQPQILKPLKKIWLTANLPCSKRLKAILPLWIPGYNQSFGPLAPEVFQALLQISPATIDRILNPVRIHYKKHGRTTTKPGTLLKKQIPIQTNQWDQSRPGFLEADTVAHCGESLSGMFTYTIDFVDIATSWTEQKAIWGGCPMVPLDEAEEPVSEFVFHWDKTSSKLRRLIRPGELRAPELSYLLNWRIRSFLNENIF